MAIDSSLWAVDIPAGTYNVGDVVELGCIDGPANVRTARGTPILKNIFVGQMNAAFPYWRIHIRNSDWIDEVVSLTATLATLTSLDLMSGAMQVGHDCVLTPNSGWSVYAECVMGGTSTADDSVFALIDIDYPSVSNVASPMEEVGIPTSIFDDVSLTSIAVGSMETSTWVTKNVDYFKAGYRYVLEAVEMTTRTNAFGFVAFSNAAGMGGLQRIIPIISQVNSIRFPIQYASPLVKGPMDIKYKVFQPTSAAIDIFSVHDYVKRGGR